ncbi:hypothetical protein FKZ61_022685 [Litorilinea aerophila]|uniref:DUF2029 domain-containing protein n=1 Tax=Litorilinea aerophila TaxID=1204385 RepID=A0A540V8Q2_9CHLR|nr:hypothetical protein [Litorilinea aerophila]MCC9078905.1 hypothetical protein [Litorilinea aerophila]OUC05221.1 hypothetical protein RY27_28570 [Litorilinea aerophila]
MKRRFLVNPGRNSPSVSTRGSAAQFLPWHLRQTVLAWYRRHYPFLVVLTLFVSFRLLAILLFRPGGFIADFSDYDFYYTWSQLVPMGYRAYDNLWTAYPPLFPALMLPIADLAHRIPPWVEPRFWFHTLFGLALLAFETGNLILIYRLGNRLRPASPAQGQTAGFWPVPGGLGSAILYSLFFVPVYTLLGWFEPYPLFFMLLALDLLLARRGTLWPLSAVVAGLGFLVKLTPALMVPIAVRRLGARLNWQALRHDWFNPRAEGNLLRPTLYGAIFLATVVGVGYPFVRHNPALAFSSFQVQSIRPPWQSLWALLDGFYGYGLVPLDMRNLAGLGGPLWESRLPWTWIGLGFALLYLYLYTRPYDWQHPRTPLAFAGASVILLFLYSKGWSPQFLLWILVFIALLQPGLYGVLVGSLLSLTNFVEANVFLIMLPEEHWLLWGTVLVRTGLLLALMAEWLGQIWQPQRRGERLQRVARVAGSSILALAVIAAVAATPQAAQAYRDRRLAEHPCREAVLLLQEEAEWPDRRIVTQQVQVWQDFYPWLHERYSFLVVDGYDGQQPDRDRSQVVAERLAQQVTPGEFWWISRPDLPESPTSPIAGGQAFLARADVAQLEVRELGACVLQRLVRLPATEVATLEADGVPIHLWAISMGRAQRGAPWHLVLYWQASAPIAGSYTVFTQLLAPDGTLVAQQDNPPGAGLAPTHTWPPGAVIRDPYRLMLPDTLAPGTYELHIGLYDATGRLPVTLPDGTVDDHISLDVRVREP